MESKQYEVIEVSDDDDRCAGDDKGYENSPYNSDDDPAKVPAKITVNADVIRSLVKCSICLGITNHTRTMMDCLHRFCKECIDKSMRLGNNKCPVCRIHCSSRRALRDDTNFDCIISSIYPNIDEYEKEELAFRGEVSHNKQTMGKAAISLGRPPQRRRTGGFRNNMTQASDDEEEIDIDYGKEFSSDDESSPKSKKRRYKRRAARRPLPEKSAVNSTCEETANVNDKKGSNLMSPLRYGSLEFPTWGESGARSHIRHGDSIASSSRVGNSDRMTKSANYLHKLNDRNDKEHYQENENFEANSIKIPSCWDELVVSAKCTDPEFLKVMVIDVVEMIKVMKLVRITVMMIPLKFQ